MVAGQPSLTILNTALGERTLFSLGVVAQVKRREISEEHKNGAREHDPVCEAAVAGGF